MFDFASGTHLRVRTFPWGHAIVAIASLSFDATVVTGTSSPCLSAPPTAVPTGTIVNVSSDSQLQFAVSSLTDNTTIVLAPGVYNLSNTLNIQRDNVTLTGATNSCDDVVLVGKGMEEANYGNVPHGVLSNAVGLTVQNLTIRDVYFHPIAFNTGAESPHIYNVKLLDAGEQFIKASSGLGWGQGVDDGVVEYTIMEYTSGPPTTDHGGGTGYTNGVDVHGGQRWVIRNNLFKNFHTPDSADHLWAPAVLMWRGSGETVTEGNVFVNVDRAIAYGLEDDSNGSSHTGGIIRNNMIYYDEGLNSPWRKSNSDGTIIVWDSPQTEVLHNTALTNGNINKFIEFRFDTTGAEAKNNLGDASISGRSGAQFNLEGNVLTASAELFVSPTDGDLHLEASVSQGLALVEVPFDIDGQARPLGTTVDVGADEFFLPADFDGNGSVDGHDFLTWQVGYGSAYSDSDLAIWQSSYGVGGLSSAAARVPEPNSLVFLSLGATLLWSRYGLASIR